MIRQASAGGRLLAPAARWPLLTLLVDYDTGRTKWLVWLRGGAEEHHQVVYRGGDSWSRLPQLQHEATITPTSIRCGVGPSPSSDWT